MGVPIQSSLVQVPCRSGSPQGVFGGAQAFAAGAALGAVVAGFGAACEVGWVWAATGVAANAIAAASRVRNRWLMSALLLDSLRLLAQTPVDQFFGKFHAFEFTELCVLLFSAIERQADFPWPRKYCFVFDGGFVIEMIGIGERVTLNDVHILAHEISNSIEPALAVQPGDVNNQRVAFPVSIGS